MLNDFGDSKVTVKKEQLLATLKGNLENHRKAFLEAQSGYREEVINQLDQQLKLARDHKQFNLLAFVSLTAPQDHTKDYQRVIRMLEMSVADEISITEQQFSQFVLDDWGWKRDFVATSMRYSKTQ